MMLLIKVEEGGSGRELRTVMENSMGENWQDLINDQKREHGCGRNET